MTFNDKAISDIAFFVGTLQENFDDERELNIVEAVLENRDGEPAGKLTWHTSDGYVFESFVSARPREES